MSAVTAVAVAGATVQIGISVSQAIQAKKAREKADKEAQRAISELKGKKYTDTFGDIQVPTLGAELEYAQQQQALKTGIEALREEGVAGALGGTTSLERQRRLAALETSARLEQHETALDLERERVQQDIANKNVGLQVGILGAEATGAQQASADAYAAQQAAMQGIAAGVGQGTEAYLQGQALYPEEGDAKKERRAAKKSARQGRRTRKRAARQEYQNDPTLRALDRRIGAPGSSVLDNSAQAFGDYAYYGDGLTS